MDSLHLISKPAFAVTHCRPGSGFRDGMFTPERESFNVSENLEVLLTQCGSVTHKCIKSHRDDIEVEQECEF